jgi:hypothetical protein
MYVVRYGPQEHADALSMELAIANQQAEVLQNENMRLQERVATLELDLVAARGMHSS